MKYICAQPAIKYFAWQIDVFIHSLINNNVNQKDIHIINSIPENGIDNYFSILKEKYSEVLFEFYVDDRSYKQYQPSIKPHLAYKHYLKHPELQKENILLLDSDVSITKPLDFSTMLNDNIWYLSDTSSYLNYDYIKSKGDDVLNKMLEVADISEHVIKSQNNNSGGAQYLIKSVDAIYWKEVEDLSHRLYIELLAMYSRKPPEEAGNYGLQIWTSEMWAMIWVAWKKGIMTLTHPELDFCWATDDIEKWDQTKIFHNAGVTCGCQNMFKKSNYTNKLPDLNLAIDETKCSFNYYNMLKKVLTYKIQ
jgi:hypothetical protein